MQVYCGIDWAEDHHDVALVDQHGAVVAKRRISDDAVGFAELAALLAEHGDAADYLVPVAIETGRGLLVACLRGTGRGVYVINPLAASRYRDRYSVARKKSDHTDAVVLANILRTDAHAHRPLPADSELVQAIAVLARAQQDTVWNRQQLTNQLRSLLREYYPNFLAAFASREGGLRRPDARAVLAAAPTPGQSATLSLAGLRTALICGGRRRGIEAEAVRLKTVFAAEQLRQLPMVEEAMGRQALALLRQLDAACQAADELAEATATAFGQHPDAEVIGSFPGLGEIAGARILAEIGDDRTRFADARALKAYAGSAPVTRASGKTIHVLTRKVKNQRLAAAGYVWAFASLTAPPQARAHYDRRREIGDRHVAAQRNLFNRLLGCLHHCLTTGRKYDPVKAFPATAVSAA